MQVLTRRDEAAVTDFLRLRKVARLKLILLAVDAHRRRLPGCRPPGCLPGGRASGSGEPHRVVDVSEDHLIRVRVRVRVGVRVRIRVGVRVRVKVRVRARVRGLQGLLGG